MPTQKNTIPAGFGAPVDAAPEGFGPAIDDQSTASPPAPEAPQPTFGSRLGEAVGVPTSIDQAQKMQQGMDFFHSANHPVLAGVGNAVLGPAGAAASAVRAYGKNLYDRAVAPLTPEESTQMQNHPVAGAVNLGTKYILGGVLGPVGGDAINNFADDAGKKHLGPAAGDLLGTAINLLTLKRGAGPTEDTRLNSLTHAAGNKGAPQFENTLATLQKTQAETGAPVRTIGDLTDVINRSKDDINAEYGNAIGPYAGRQIYPGAISQRIRSLITPDMQYTAEGRAEANAIKNAALEYEKPWTLGALDSKRSRLAADLASHNAKESVGRYTAERGSVNLAVDNAILDGLRDTVYPQADALAGKPTGYFENLKQQQSDLIRLQQTLNKQVDTLHNASRGSKGTPPLSRIHAGAGFSSHGPIPHGYVGGIPQLLKTRDIEAEANAAVAKGMGSGGPASKALVMSYPARYLALSSQPMVPVDNPPQQ